jgi:hypothetical protein
LTAASWMWRKSRNQAGIAVPAQPESPCDRRDFYSVSQPTPLTSLAAHAAVTVYCRHCQHSAPLDLAGMAEAGEAGHGDTPLIELPLRCDRCGAIAYRISVGR